MRKRCRPNATRRDRLVGGTYPPPDLADAEEILDPETVAFAWNLDPTAYPELSALIRASMARAREREEARARSGAGGGTDGSE